MTAQPVSAELGYGHAIVFQLIAVFLFATMGGLVKFTASHYPTSEVLFFPSLPALVPLLIYLPRQGGWSALRTRRPDLQTIRAVAGITSMFMGFYALARMDYASYVAISFTAPLFGTLLAIPFLADKVGWRRMSAVGVGFLGVVLTVDPSLGGIDLMALLALGGAFGYGVVMIAMRKLGAVDKSAATVFYFTTGSMLVSAVVMIREWVTPTPRDLALLILLGLLGGVAQIFMTEAYRMAPPSVVAPFDYTAMVWALIIGWLAFGSFPGPQVLLGAAVICGSGMFIIYRETVRGVSRKVKGTSL